MSRDPVTLGVAVAAFVVGLAIIGIVRSTQPPDTTGLGPFVRPDAAAE